MPIVSGGGGGGGLPLSGGTLTGALTVNQSVADSQVSNGLVITENSNTNSGVVAGLTDNGSGNASATFKAVAKANGNAFFAVEDDSLNGELAYQTDGNPAFYISQRTSVAASQSVLQIQRGFGAPLFDVDGTGAITAKSLATKPLTSGALPTVQLVTATGAQILTTRDCETITPCTFNPGAATTATVTVALSPDNVTYSTLAVVTEPAGVALDGTILPINVRVPAGWYLKLTVNAQAVLGLTTYY